MIIDGFSKPILSVRYDTIRSSSTPLLISLFLNPNVKFKLEEENQQHPHFSVIVVSKVEEIRSDYEINQIWIIIADSDIAANIYIIELVNI